MALSPKEQPGAGAPRIGVYGGAFDPPHVAHLALARAALAQLGLAELRVLPTGQPWHRSGRLSDAAHRLAMAELAFAVVAGARVDPREVRRAGPTYTLDTLRELQTEQAGAELVLVLGADQAVALPRWHGWQEILDLAVVAVAQRPAADGTITPFDARRQLPDLPAGARFESIALPPLAVSATDIRARCARGEDIAELVPPGVARYIELHHLYRS